MTNPVELRQLADAAELAPPFSFEEFERRRTAAEHRRRATVWSSAASVVVLGVVALLALVTQRPEPVALVANATPGRTSVVKVARPYQPALVDLGHFAVTSDLEDHIALLDAQISAARVYAAPSDQLRQLEYTRQQLNDSLQRVSYAQTLLDF